MLSGCFAIASDGWRGEDAHYVTLFAAFSSSHHFGYDSARLSIAKMRDRDSLRADDLFEHLKFEPSVPSRTMASVGATMDDDEDTRTVFTRHVGQKSIFCNGHCYSLALKDVISGHIDEAAKYKT